MIPKIIHYCWFGRHPLPELAKKCITSWHKYLPNYEIKEWNEDNFDVNMIPYTAEAYRMKKYAFVSDYARFWILYNYGGLYFDTDVEIIKPLDDIIARGNFMGYEKIRIPNDGNAITSSPMLLRWGVNPGLGIGAAAATPFYKKVLDIYNDKSFMDKNGIITDTVVTIVTRLLRMVPSKIIDGSIDFIDDIYIYPIEYFCPKDYYSGKLSITNKTRTIHHYSATWLSWYEKWEKAVFTFFHLRYHGLIKRHIIDKFK